MSLDGAHPIEAKTDGKISLAMGVVELNNKALESTCNSDVLDRPDVLSSIEAKLIIVG